MTGAGMKVTTEFPKEIFEQRDVRIPLTDGSELSARIWRPTSKEPVPAIVEYIPYRQRDLTAVRDSIHHPYIPGHGYACVRVDLRGSGDSDGALVAERNRLWPRLLPPRRLPLPWWVPPV